VPRRWWSPGPALMAFEILIQWIRERQEVGEDGAKYIEPDPENTDPKKTARAGLLFSGLSTMMAASARLKLLTA